METRFRIPIVLLLLALLHPLCTAAQPEPAQPRAIDFTELEATVKEELKATNTPGAAVAVIIGDRVVYAKGFGVADVETATPVTPDTLFRIASTTKMLTAATLVALAGQGKLNLNEPIGRHVKGLSPGLSRVTVHQLLSHTAGLRDGASFNGPHDDSALAGFVRSWTDDYLIAEPGEIYSYSNLGYVLAAFVLEEVTGRPFADGMEDLLFRPLGMRRTSPRPIMAMTYPLAQGHDIPAGQTAPVVVRPFADDSRYWANGGVFTSVADYSRFVIAFLNGGRIDGVQALPPAVIEKLSTPHVRMPGGSSTENPRHGYGLNIRDYRGVRVLQHSGQRIGFASLVRIAPEQRFAVIILGNKSDGLLLRSLEKATELAIPLQPRPASAPREPVVMTDAEMKSYVGIYQNAPDYLRLELLVKDGKLLLKQVGQEATSPVAKVGDSVLTAGGQEFVLIKGSDGSVRHLHIAGHALRKLPLEKE
jgi:CubicO group peptidase (beta-lactamase class C family)